MKGILKCHFGFKPVLRYALVFMLLVNSFVPSKMLNNETTKYAYLMNSDSQGLFSESIAVTICFDVLFARGEGYFEVLRKNCTPPFL